MGLEDNVDSIDPGVGWGEVLGRDERKERGIEEEEAERKEEEKRKEEKRKRKRRRAREIYSFRINL